MIAGSRGAIGSHWTRGAIRPSRYTKGRAQFHQSLIEISRPGPWHESERADMKLGVVRQIVKPTENAARVAIERRVSLLIGDAQYRSSGIVANARQSA
jgi:hypothetical protein